MAVRTRIPSEEDKKKPRPTFEPRRGLLKQLGEKHTPLCERKSIEIPQRKEPPKFRAREGLITKKQVTFEPRRGLLTQLGEKHTPLCERKSIEIPERKEPPNFRAREGLITKKQVVHASMSWRPCSNLPTKISDANATIIDDHIYCGGGTAEIEDKEYIVYCYDLSKDKWTTLPQLPVKYFGLGQVSENLVAVGGKKKIDDRATNGIYSFDDEIRRWKQTVPVMPTARFAASVLSLKSALIVAGGRSTPSSFTDAVEVFKHEQSQWYQTDPLPVPCSSISLVAAQGTCFALGGYKYLTRLDQALYASVDDLLRHAVPVSQTLSICRRNPGTTPSWKEYPKVPSSQPMAAEVAGNILALGGKKMSSGTNSKEVYMYLDSINSWIYFSDLPVPLFGTAVVDLSSTEILVIGGYSDTDRVTTVLKGNLCLKI